MDTGMEPVAQQNSSTADYGLRREILSPMETLAQSVSTMAPTTTPAATIPLVCALAGNGTWLAYVLATWRDPACGSVHQPLCPALGVSGITLHLRLYDSAAVARGHCGVEPSSRLRRYRLQRDWRLLSLRQPAASRRDRPWFLRGAALGVRHRSLDLDCLSRREDFRPPHAVDRSCVGDRHRGGRGAAAGASRMALGLGPTPPSRHDGQRLAPRAGAGAVQLCGLRKRDYFGIGSAQSASNRSRARSF